MQSFFKFEWFNGYSRVILCERTQVQIPPGTLFSKKTGHRNISVLTLFGSENVREYGGKKKTEKFRPIAVRNPLITPYGRKVLGNSKQCCTLFTVENYWIVMGQLWTTNRMVVRITS